MIDCMVFNTIFNTIPVIYRQCTYPCFPGILLTSTPHNILSKPLAALSHNHCQNNGQPWERNESCCNDYRQSLERILAKPGIKPATSCSQVRNATNWATGLGSSSFKRYINFNNSWQAKHVSIFTSIFSCSNIAWEIINKLMNELN